MSSILIKGVRVWTGRGEPREKDIYIEGNLIEEIAEPGQSGGRESGAEFVIPGHGKVAIPGLFNAHTHAAMTLLRGYADDMPLQEWLTMKIWPVEVRMTEEDVYWGTKLACLEMIKTGTVFFNDMYWHFGGIAKAVSESGIRAAVSAVFIDGFDEDRAKEQIMRNEELYRGSRRGVGGGDGDGDGDGRLIFVLGPHSVYTVSEESLCWVRDFAAKHDLLVHIHLSETEEEVEDCIKRYGMRPVEFLDSIGFLSSRVIASHCVHLNKRELGLLKQHEVKIVHNPTSNMKLSAGRMPYEEMKEMGMYRNIALGTDGCASNNNLDMFEEMKIASLFHKAFTEPTVMPAEEAFELATVNAARMFRLNSGVIEEGKLADIVLLDMKNEALIPDHNLISNIVYAANGSCVDTVICDGRILMVGREIEGEEEIKERAKEVARKLVEGR